MHMERTEHSTQLWILVSSVLGFSFGIQSMDKSIRAGYPIFELRGLTYTGGLAVFSIAALVCVSGVLLVSSLRNLRQ